MAFEQIVAGIGAGITYALTGWGKAEGEEFDTVKFLTTCGVGAVSGIISLVNGLDMPTAYAMGLAFTPLVENLIKIFTRKVMIAAFEPF